MLATAAWWEPSPSAPIRWVSVLMAPISGRRIAAKARLQNCGPATGLCLGRLMLLADRTASPSTEIISGLQGPPTFRNFALRTGPRWASGFLLVRAPAWHLMGRTFGFQFSTRKWWQNFNRGTGAVNM